MLTGYRPIRVETLIALALSGRWPRQDMGLATTGEETGHDGLPFLLSGLNLSDRESAEVVLRGFVKLSPEDQRRWISSRLNQVRSSTPERNRRFDKEIHPSQIADALRREPVRIQTLIVNSLPQPQAEPVAEALGLPVGKDIDPQLAEPAGAMKVARVVRRAFFAQFVFTNALSSLTPLDLLSGVELARLIRLLGVRETAIACRGIAAVETVTAFLKRFSAEDAHAIVFHLRSLKQLEPQRVIFAETIARKAINEESSVASTMLDRVGLTLLAIVLGASSRLRRRHTAQKLPLAAARELNQLMNNSRGYCEREMASHILAEAQSLADTLHRSPEEGKR